MKTPELYSKFYIEKNNEQTNLFKILKEKYKPGRGLYPGSFVHITPSFYFEDMTYVDNDKRIKKFFNNPGLVNYINRRKTYISEAVIVGIEADYWGDLQLKSNSFDIMFSFYSGFVSQACKKFLKVNGVLIANDSHGDASIAYLDKDYELSGAIISSGVSFAITESDLEIYFKKKNGNPINREKILKEMKGEYFTRDAYAYIFHKKGNSN